MKALNIRKANSSVCGLVVSTTNQTTEALVRPMGGQNTPANFSNIVNPLLVTNDGGGGMLNQAI